MEEEKIRTRGRLTLYFIIINVIISILIFSYPGGSDSNIFFSLFSFSGGSMFEVWRWFTSMFIHLNASHLFFNMIGLYFFGKALENKVDAKWWLIIYFVSGILGNLAHMLTSSASVIGASGAVFGLMGASMLLNPMKKIYVYVFPLPLGLVAIAMALFESMMAAAGAGVSMVANTAHVAGLMTGAIFAFFHSPKHSVKGILLLVFLLILLILLVPIFILISSIGGIILNAIESVVGFFIYGLANMLSFMWL